MDGVLVLIALSAGVAVTLFTVYTYRQLTFQHRLVRARISSDGSGLAFLPGSILRVPRGARVPFAGILPLSIPARERMALELERAGWAMQPGEFLAIRFACAITACLAGVTLLAHLGVPSPGLRVAIILALTLLGWFGPRMYLTSSKQRRIEAINRQLPDALTSIAKSLRAGSGLHQGLAYAANETRAPLGPELQGALRDLQLGADAEDVFGALSRRVGSPDLDIAVTAIVIQRRTGGNLSEILTNVADTIRERLRLQGDIRVLTTQQRLGSYVAAALPILVAVAFMLLQPQMGILLVTTTPGLIALGVGLGFEVAGILLIRELAQIDV
jgi:tight adherence protein B